MGDEEDDNAIEVESRRHTTADGQQSCWQIIIMNLFLTLPMHVHDGYYAWLVVRAIQQETGTFFLLCFIACLIVEFFKLGAGAPHYYDVAFSRPSGHRFRLIFHLVLLAGRYFIGFQLRRRISSDFGRFAQGKRSTLEVTLQSVLLFDGHVEHPFGAKLIGDGAKVGSPPHVLQGVTLLAVHGECTKETVRFRLGVQLERNFNVVASLELVFLNARQVVISHQGKVGSESQRRVQNSVLVLGRRLVFHGRVTPGHHGVQLGSKYL